MNKLFHIIRRPLVTEKSEAQNAQFNRVVFEVTAHATKHEIQAAVESIFKVKVVKVHTLRLGHKRRRTMRGWAIKKPRWKKAVVTLAEGQKIDFYEGVKA